MLITGHSLSNISSISDNRIRKAELKDGKDSKKEGSVEELHPEIECEGTKGSEYIELDSYVDKRKKMALISIPEIDRRNGEVQRSTQLCLHTGATPVSITEFSDWPYTKYNMVVQSNGPGGSS